METIIEGKNDKMVLRLNGNLTIYEISDIQKEIINSFAGDMNLEIDLSGVEECDTAGIQVLLSLASSAKDIKKKFTVLKISDAVIKVARELAIDLDESFSIEGV